MGCDIHLHIEVKIIDNMWSHYAAPSIDRWYELFGKMAGVRNKEIEPISLPKGLPRDMSAITTFSAMDLEQDGHSHSWLSSEEIKILADWLRNYSEKDWMKYDLEYAILHTYLEGNSFAGDFPEWVQNVRFVFWFDN